MAFMKSISEKEAFISDGFIEAHLNSFCINSKNYAVVDNSTDRSFLLMDANENLRIPNSAYFSKILKCCESDKLKVCTIFGNAGDGKSHTMNHVFFKGEEVFKTSKSYNSCTMGVYAALEPNNSALCLDTEGLLSSASKNNRRMRMLLKVLAISDVVIYRTRSERLHSDMFEFFDTASKAIKLHFSETLQSLAGHDVINLGPDVIVFQETRHADPLCNFNGDNMLRESFHNLNCDIKAFRSVEYVGLRTSSTNETDYSPLISIVLSKLHNRRIKLSTTLNVIIKTLQDLNEKFCGEIEEKSINRFPEQYFTCCMLCIACNRRCQRSNGHEGESHSNSQPCKHQDQFENKAEFCKSCDKNGREVIVSRIDGLAHTIISCEYCGEIGRIWKYWIGGQECPSVCIKPVHIWNDRECLVKGPSHPGQQALEKLSYVCELFTNYSSQPTGVFKDWCADIVAPKYWKANSEIIICSTCNKNFENTGLRKHHCRGCGEGFCDGCTQYRMPVPGRKWFDAVRVCVACRRQLLNDPNCIPGSIKQVFAGEKLEESNININTRKYGEIFYNTVSNVAGTAVECTKELIKDFARPDYWVTDAEAVCCHICKILFGTADDLALTYSSNNASGKYQTSYKGGQRKRHHCRKCGRGVCAECSLTRRPVPDRGWTDEVRVCDECAKNMSTGDTALGHSKIKSE